MALPNARRTRLRRVWLLLSAEPLLLGLAAQTQFEAYLSLRKVSTRGLSDTPATERRLTIRRVDNTPVEFERALLEAWASKTPDEARLVLISPGVIVTNQGDKLVQLEKLVQLNEFAQRVFATTGLVSPRGTPLASPRARAVDASSSSHGACDIFISMRFGEAMDEGVELQRQLETRGVRAFICDTPPGTNLLSTIAAALDACRLAVILASETYGKATNHLFDTSKELAFVISEGKPVRALSCACLSQILSTWTWLSRMALPLERAGPACRELQFVRSCVCVSACLRVRSRARVRLSFSSSRCASVGLSRPHEWSLEPPLCTRSGRWGRRCPMGWSTR